MMKPVVTRGLEEKLRFAFRALWLLCGLIRFAGVEDTTELVPRLSIQKLVQRVLVMLASIHKK
jgi:hypothetical protein